VTKDGDFNPFLADDISEGDGGAPNGQWLTDIFGSETSSPPNGHIMSVNYRLLGITSHRLQSSFSAAVMRCRRLCVDLSVRAASLGVQLTGAALAVTSIAAANEEFWESVPPSGIEGPSYRLVLLWRWVSP
jgi:hypothetical protein